MSKPNEALIYGYGCIGNEKKLIFEIPSLPLLENRPIYREAVVGFRKISVLSYTPNHKLKLLLAY